MINFLEKLGEKLYPVAEKLGNNKFLMAMKDGFINIMPLLIIGSMVVVLNNVVLEWGENSLWYGLGIQIDAGLAAKLAEYKIFGGFIWQGTLAIMALLVSFTIAYNLAKQNDDDAISVAVLSVAAFFVIQAWSVDVAFNEAGDTVTAFAVNTGNIGGANIITAILISLFTGTVYNWFSHRKIMIKMPEGVPPSVGRAFEALIPGAVILSIAALIASVLQMNFDVEFSQLITMVIAEPLQKIGSDGPIVAYLYVTLSNILYFFGIHGPNVLSFVDMTVLTPNAVANADALAQGLEPTIIFSKGMLDSFVFLGGGGATLGLIIAIFVASRHKADRAMAKFAIAPGLFNINEPLVFGLPIVMNPILFIPFVILPPLLLTTAWLQINFFHAIGLLQNTGGVLIPWVSPVGIGAFLSYQSFFAIVIALIQLAIATIVYLPFVFAMNKVRDKEVEMELNANS
ncbi:PTS transporter subunit EIIC [Mollicutes bacterium LVI A0039]|nr:PTS transporter subunit EIIC [Mollicutes bacterium LVI A0039]